MLLIIGSVKNGRRKRDSGKRESDFAHADCSAMLAGKPA